MAVLVIVGLAIGLQVITAIAVRRLIQVAGRPWGWVSWAARKQAEEALSIRIEQMQAVHTIAEEITGELDFAQLPHLIVQRAAALLGTPRSVLYLWDEATQTLRPQAWCNTGAWLTDLPLRLGEGVAGVVAQRREGMLVNDSQHAPYAYLTFIEQYGPAMTMAEPLLYRDRLIGVLVVTHDEPGRFFLMPDREPLAVLAAQATIALEKARLFRKIHGCPAPAVHQLRRTAGCRGDRLLCAR